MSDEGFVEDQAGSGLDPAGPSALDPRTAALLRVGACVATGSPGVCLEWSTGRALAAGAAEDEIANALLAIAQVAGLGRVGRRLQPGELLGGHQQREVGRLVHLRDLHREPRFCCSSTALRPPVWYTDCTTW